MRRRDIRYKLRDLALFPYSATGRAFPNVWRDGKHEALAESELPLEPPAARGFQTNGDWANRPLAKAKDWIRYSDSASRETNTMPQWALLLGYICAVCDPQNDKRFVGEEPRALLDGGLDFGNRIAESGK